MAEVRYYGLGILAHINNTKKGRVDDHFDINSVLFLFREPDIFLLTRYSPFVWLRVFLRRVFRAVFAAGDPVFVNQNKSHERDDDFDQRPHESGLVSL